MGRTFKSYLPLFVAVAMMLVPKFISSNPGAVSYFIIALGTVFTIIFATAKVLALYKKKSAAKILAKETNKDTD